MNMPLISVNSAGSHKLRSIAKLLPVAGLTYVVSTITEKAEIVFH